MPWSPKGSYKMILFVIGMISLLIEASPSGCKRPTWCGAHVSCKQSSKQSSRSLTGSNRTALALATIPAGWWRLHKQSGGKHEVWSQLESKENSNYLNCYFLTFCQNNVAFIVAPVLFMVPFHFIPLIRSTCVFWLINCTNPLTMICKKSVKLQKARLTSVIRLLVSLEESLWGS